MKRRNKDEVAALEPLRRRLGRWRSGHEGHFRRIPEDIWRESARAARRYGVAAVAHRLRLDYYSLKSRLDGLSGVKRPADNAPTFVELVPTPVKKNSANAIELQTARGSKFRIEFEGELTKEVSALSERLWRAAR